MIGVLRLVTATRYVTPLREGGSLPGVVEADDLGTYVVKFRGAGQGPKALVAEVIAGELARRLELPIPDLVVTELDPVVARAEPDEEVQQLIKASAGANLGMDFLPGALGFDAVAHPVDAGLASRVLCFDAFVENVDRSWRNPNLLIWHGRTCSTASGCTARSAGRRRARPTLARYFLCSDRRSRDGGCRSRGRVSPRRIQPGAGSCGCAPASRA